MSVWQGILLRDSGGQDTDECKVKQSGFWNSRKKAQRGYL
mgnify:CR=1 FL=1